MSCIMLLFILKIELLNVHTQNQWVVKTANSTAWYTNVTGTSLKWTNPFDPCHFSNVPPFLSFLHTVFLTIHASLPILEMIDLGSLATMFPPSVEAVRSEARPWRRLVGDEPRRHPSYRVQSTADIWSLSTSTIDHWVTDVFTVLTIQRTIVSAIIVVAVSLTQIMLKLLSACVVCHKFILRHYYTGLWSAGHWSPR